MYVTCLALLGSGIARGQGGATAPWQKLCPPLAPPPEMKLHFVQRSMESRHFESQLALLLTPEPPLLPSHFEKSGYAPAAWSTNLVSTCCMP